MTKILEIPTLLEWNDMRQLINILPDLDGHFKSRKWFDEYYNDLHNYKRVFTLEEIINLSKEFSLEIWYNCLIIKQ